MNIRRRTRNVVIIAAATALMITGAGAAYAYWSGAASGTGAGGTGTLAAVSLSPGTPGAALYPGGQTNVVLTATNSNDSVAHIGSLSIDTAQGSSGFAVDGAHSGCVLSTLSFTTQTNGGAGWDVPARVGVVNGTLNVTLTNALAMSLGAVSTCQGATFTAYLKAP
ncbi:MAG: hypothetical protein ABIQ01_08270 [Pseudolysinimonas sp.]